MAAHPIEAPQLLSHSFQTIVLAANGGTATIAAQPIMQPFRGGQEISGSATTAIQASRLRIDWHVDDSVALSNLGYIQAVLILKAGGPDGTAAPYADTRDVTGSFIYRNGDVTVEPVAQFYSDLSLTLTNWNTSAATLYVRTLVYGDPVEYTGMEDDVVFADDMPGGIQ